MKKCFFIFLVLSSCIILLNSCENSVNSIELLDEQSNHSSLTKSELEGCYTILPSGLISWWKADGNAFDSHGSNNGYPQGNVGYQLGYINNAFNFNGIYDYILVPDNPSLDFGPYQDFSFGAWFKGQQQSGPQGTILSKISWVGARLWGYELSLRGIGTVGHPSYPSKTVGKVSIWLANGNTPDPYKLYSTCRYDDDKWHHVMVTVDRDDLVKLYVDGILVDDEDISESADINHISMTNFEIGRETAFRSYYYRGLIDEVTVFNKALSQEEVINMYEACEIINGPFEPCIIEVAIEMPHSINCQVDKGILPVVILTTPDFDALTVDHTTVRFGVAGSEVSETHVDKKTGEARRHEEDVDGDGDIDLLFHFRKSEMGLVCETMELCLTGKTYDNNLINGCNIIVAY